MSCYCPVPLPLAISVSFSKSEDFLFYILKVKQYIQWVKIARITVHI